MTNIPLSEEISTLKRSIRLQLTGQKFRGNYAERRYVNDLQLFRDIVIVSNNINTNRNMQKYLQHAKDTITSINSRTNNIPDDYWIGITSPQMPGAPAGGFAIWTELTDLPFGNYIFTVRRVSFRDNEMMLKLDVVDENILQELIENQNTEGNRGTFEDYRNLIEDWIDAIKREIYLFLRSQITKENIIAAIKFIFACSLLLLIQGRDLLKFIGLYSLQAMAEFRKFLYVSTPIILALIDLVKRVIGAIFLILHQLLFSSSAGRPRQDVVRRRALTEF